MRMRLFDSTGDNSVYIFRLWLGVGEVSCAMQRIAYPLQDVPSIAIKTATLPADVVVEDFIDILHAF